MNRMYRYVIALLVLAVPLGALAQGFGRPGRGAHRGGSLVSGTVSTISGNTITLLEGAIAIDATDAAVMVRGTAATLSAIVPGTMVTAFLDDPNDTGALDATMIAVHFPPDAHLAGVVQAIDLVNSTFTVLGVQIAVTEETLFGGRRGNAGLSGLADLQLNQPVGVAVDLAAGRVTAVRVHRAGGPQRPGERMLGTVKTIESGSWVITGSDGIDKVFVVNDDTRILGEPKVGESVHVHYLVDAAGANVALAIVRSDLPLGPGPGNGTGGGNPGHGGGQGGPPAQPGPNHVSFEGTVNTISGQLWTVGSTVVQVMPRTKITGNPQVGDAVRVEGAKRPDGTVTAFSITKK